MQENNNDKKVRIYPEKMTDADISGVAELEKLCFHHSAWTEQSLELLTKEGIGMGMVCRRDGHAVAYGGMLCVVDEGQITNIATHPDYRRQGYASAVVEALKKYAKNNRLDVVTLEVRESNAAAIKLYTSHGFKIDGKRRGFYTNPTEDAVLMSCKIK